MSVNHVKNTEICGQFLRIGSTKNGIYPNFIWHFIFLIKKQFWLYFKALPIVGFEIFWKINDVMPIKIQISAKFLLPKCNLWQPNRIYCTKTQSMNIEQPLLGK